MPALDMHSGEEGVFRRHTFKAMRLPTAINTEPEPEERSIEEKAFHVLEGLVRQHGAVEITYHEPTEDIEPFYQVLVYSKTTRTIKQRADLALGMLAVKGQEPVLRCCKCKKNKVVSQLWVRKNRCKVNWAMCIPCNRRRGRNPLNDPQPDPSPGRTVKQAPKGRSKPRS